MKARAAWWTVAALLALGGCDRGSSSQAATSSDPVVARMIQAEKAICACKSQQCVAAADHELRAWSEVYADDIRRAMADPSREAQVDVHRGRADACKKALGAAARVAGADDEGDDGLSAFSADGADAAIAKMGRMADKLCECRDMKCAEGVMKEMASIKAPSGKPSQAQMEKAMKIAEQMAECQKKLMQADMPPAPPTPPATVPQ